MEEVVNDLEKCVANFQFGKLGWGLEGRGSGFGK